MSWEGILKDFSKNELDAKRKVLSDDDRNFMGQNDLFFLSLYLTKWGNSHYADDVMKLSNELEDLLLYVKEELEETGE
jgi:hypothetical protein|tara:strand:+ start:506 stop:739 length:234 start_codon:yes stop_codon:yes gene_type:complete